MIRVHRELPVIIEKTHELKRDVVIESFCPYVAPAMAKAEYIQGSWKEVEIMPYGPLPIYPDCKVFHYAQEIFEGMKAYWNETPNPLLFRPEENFMRFNASARRMAMPEIPRQIFMDAVTATADFNRSFIPREVGKSLYLRPFMFASENQLGIKPSNRFTFMVLAAPAASYMGQDYNNVMIERQYSRAAMGGTGAAKTGGNYAASQLSSLKAHSKNFQQVMWLDAAEHKYIEELSGMNVFFVRKNKLVTPILSGTILEGITRKSILQLAQEDLHIPCSEEKLNIDTVVREIQNGDITEAFACGTAAVVTPLTSLGEESGTLYSLKEKAGPITLKVKKHLLDLQEGRTKDIRNFVQEVPSLKSNIQWVD